MARDSSARFRRDDTCVEMTNMLTLLKIQTYERFRGDMDNYSRAHGGGDTSGITDEDWWLINELCQGLYLVAFQKASENFGIEVEQKLHSVTTDEPTRKALRQLAMRLV